MIETLLKPGMVLIPLILTLKSRGRLFCECEASLFTQGVPDQLGIHNETLSQEEKKEKEREREREREEESKHANDCWYDNPWAMVKKEYYFGARNKAS